MANVCREAAYGPIREAAESIQHIAAEEVGQHTVPCLNRISVRSGVYIVSVSSGTAN